MRDKCCDYFGREYFRGKIITGLDSDDSENDPISRRWIDRCYVIWSRHIWLHAVCIAVWDDILAVRRFCFPSNTTYGQGGLGNPILRCPCTSSLWLISNLNAAQFPRSRGPASVLIVDAFNKTYSIIIEIIRISPQQRADLRHWILSGLSLHNLSRCRRRADSL